MQRNQVIKQADAIVNGPRAAEVAEWFQDWQNGVVTRAHFVSFVTCIQDKARFTTEERREVAAQVFIHPKFDA
jgi:hypothetical protein